MIAFVKFLRYSYFIQVIQVDKYCVVQTTFIAFCLEIKYVITFLFESSSYLNHSNKYKNSVEAIYTSLSYVIIFSGLYVSQSRGIEFDFNNVGSTCCISRIPLP